MARNRSQIHATVLEGSEWLAGRITSTPGFIDVAITAGEITTAVESARGAIGSGRAVFRGGITT
jgi:hypothetical protein